MGGYLSALIAGRHQLRNGVCVGVVMLLPVGGLFFLWLMNELNQGMRDTPGLAERVVALASLVPLAALGGWFRQNQVEG